MQEYTSPGQVAIGDRESLTTALWAAVESDPERAALAYRAGGAFVDVSLRAFGDQVLELARGIVGLGIEPGARIAIHSATRYEWALLDYAIWTAGCVTVPIYETSSAEQVDWILRDSDSVAIFTEDAELRAVYDDAATSCQHAFVIEEGGLEELKSAGSGITADEVMARQQAVGPDAVATIVYTSGTTGRPKGCVITHGNFVWDVAQVSAGAPFFAVGRSTLLFLPLAHIFARIIQVACLRTGVKLGFSTGIPHLVEELQLFHPDFLLAVPRVFEKVYNGARQKAHDEGKGAIFDRAARVAIDYSRESATGHVSLSTRLQHALFDRLVYRKLRHAMGGNIEYAVSGGASLGERLGHFFNGVGVLILEGYGLTETTAGATLNRPEAFKIGTVGRPLPGVSVRIADDGEILLKGGNIFRGYFNNDEATAEVIEDGWFHTGDIGRLDNEGYLRITGRKKELIVTAAGKNVAPAVLEDRIRAHPLVSQTMVIGDNQPFVAALVTIDPEAFPAWAEANGKEGKSVSDLVDDPDLRAAVQEAIDDANQAVSRAESVREFRILPQDFEVGAELSQKQSVKRHVVADKHAQVIESIYGG